MDLNIINSKPYVTYEDFNAAGDGKTDDFPAIKKAHAFANEHRRAVKADPTKTYLIGPSPEPAIIMTDTDWGGAGFIVDDRGVKFEDRNIDIFEVVSAIKPYELEPPPGIRKGQQRIKADLKQNALVIAVNDKKKQFMRKGLNVNAGYNQTDCFIVDQSGCILTPVIWDFENVSSLTAYPIDEKALLITGGEFTTVSTRHWQEVGYSYIARGINIFRSNVTVTGLTHHVTDEPEEKGSPYAGFVRTHRCAYIEFRDCHFAGHKIYQTIGAANLPVSMGTYDITCNATAGVSFIGCRQDNIMDTARWGVIGSNGCKNILLDGCVFSRMDAHMNVANLTVRNTILGHQGFNAIGHGRLTAENVTIMGSAVINLRSDYGSTWDGELYLKNITWYPADRGGANPAAIMAFNSGGHDFGYRCGFPHKVVIENLRVMDGQHGCKHDYVGIFGGVDESNDELTGFDEPRQGDFPFYFADKLIANNLSTESGKGFRIWTGNMNRIYCSKTHGRKGDEIIPNFRAELTDIDRFEYNAEGCGEPAGSHGIVADIRISECPEVVIRAAERPVKLSTRDCGVDSR